jgi:type VI protein secretion system component VasK
MKGRLVGLILPASVAGVALGATAAAHKGGIISDGVFFWLWPCLVALLWLALAIGAFIMRWTKWAWPPLAAFVAQLVGLLLLVSRTIKTPLEVLWYSLGTFVAVLLVILIIWLIVTLRTRALEKKLVEGGGEGVDAQALARIRKDMAEALSMLRRAGTGRNAIYELPWLLVMGRPQGGKTFAIKNSGLSLPVRKDWVKGAGGTFTADWFFTNEMIFLDTPGKWVQEGVTEEGSKSWTELLRLLRRHRGRRPLDGLVVVVPADDLLSKSADELAEQAAHVREVIDLIHDELKFRFPVYLLVSKTDLVEGFVDFFKGLPANRKHQIFGWSHPDPNDREAIGSIRKAFGRVLRRMQAIRLEILARTASATAVRRLFFFTEEFRRLEDPLVEFAEALFQSDPYHETPVFRGFYFTSATQGEGAPLGQAMAQLARNLGVRSTPPAAAETEAKRSYFLLEMFRTLMVGDEGLVSRTAGHWLRRRRDTVLAAFLPATIAAALLFFALISFFWNRSTYRDAAVEIPRVVAELASRDNVSSDALEALQGIDRIRRYHEKMTGFTLFRGLGMRQPGELRAETFRIFRDELQTRVLRPTFQRAQAIALDPAKDFATRADAFYSVVWLRQGNVVEYGDDLKGFEGIWSGLGPQQASDARQLLVEQFEELVRSGPSQKNLLEGFDLAAVAEALRKGTADMGSTSAIKRYIGFQDACAAPGTPNEIRRCDKLVRDILNFGERDLARLSSNLQRLKTDLRELHGVETGADEALESLREITLPERTSEQCFETFEKDIVPSMKDYYVGRQDELVKQCQSIVDQKSKAAVHPTLDAQDADLKKQQTAIADKVSQFNESCRTSLERTGSVDPVPLFKLSRSYRLVECVRERDLSGDLVKKAAGAPAPGGVRPPPRPGGGVRPPSAPSEVGGLKFFSRGAGLPGGYNQDAFDRKKTEQAEEIEFAKGLPQAQKAQKDSQIRRAIDEYGTAYERAWEQYLRAIRLKGDPPEDPGAWIQALAQTGEWRTVLEPASDAVGLAGDPSDPHFGGFYRKLQGLSSVSAFLNSGLGMYTGLLKQVGQDVARCQSNPALAGQFRSALGAGDPGNSLVKAQSWVDQNGGESLAQGSLRELLQRPLNIARDALGTSADPNKRWTELVRASQQLSHRYPFSGVETDDLATPDEVRAVLGGLSGIVPKLYAEKDKLQLGSEAKAWLDRARALSEVFFDPGNDAIKLYNLKLSVNEKLTKIEPKKAADDEEWRLEALEFDMTDKFAWRADKDLPTTKTVKLDLFGENASGIGRITLTVGHMGREGIKRKVVWEDVEPPTVVASEDGAWAPLRALAKVMPQGAAGDRVTLEFTAPFLYKSKKVPDGKLTVPFEIQGRQLANVLDLIQHGLKPAPASQ